MEVVIGIVIGALLAAAGIWKFYVKKLQASEKLAQTNYSEAAKRIVGYNDAIDACWYASFGPAGSTPTTKKELFDVLWSLGGKPAKGAP